MNQFSHSFGTLSQSVSYDDTDDFSDSFHSSSVDNVLTNDNNVAIPSEIVSVKGNLRKSLSFWKSFCSDAFILDIVEFGYKLPFTEIPPSSVSSNNRSAIDHSDFVQESISQLLESGCVRLMSTRPYIVNPLSVSVQNSGKKRLILDLRKVNLFLAKYKFKLEDLSNVKEVLSPNDYMFKFDLKSGYHHVDICSEHHKYLGFSWNFNGVVKYFAFTVLPFGLSTAPYIFTKLLVPLKRKWRGEGIINFIFIDDGWFKVDHETANDVVAKVQADLSHAGFLANEDKCVWHPKQVLTWLGAIIDSRDGSFSPTDSRIQKISVSIEELSKFGVNSPCPVKSIASLAGQIVSLKFCFGNLVSLMTRNIYSCVDSRSSWYCTVFLTSGVFEEFNFWRNFLLSFERKSFWFESKAELVVYSDASDTGFAGYITKHNNSIAHGQWTYEESLKSSTWREMKAVCNSIESLKSQLKGKRVKWFTDSQNVVSIIQKGSNKSELHCLAVQLFWFCYNNNIALDVQWIPRDQNVTADELSRFVDRDDWSINDYTFCFLSDLWGYHTVDRFANVFNSKLPRFNSRFWNPGCEAVDAFTQNWKGENNWIVPPVCLIIRVIKHLRECQATGTLLVPFWVSAVYWPFLCPDGVHFHDFVHDVKYFRFGSSIIRKGRCKSCIFGNSNFDIQMLALRISFEVSPRQRKLCCKRISGVSCSDCDNL